jgi:hypothetical protein
VKRLIKSIQKNGRETIRVELDEFEGRQLVAARIWYTDGEGDLKPTRKGLTIAIRHLPAIREALEEAERVARKAGLLGDEEAAA